MNAPYAMEKYNKELKASAFRSCVEKTPATCECSVWLQL